MSAKKDAPKKKPGRPKKVESIPVSEFKRIINKRPIGYNVEFVYTYPITFKKFIETFSSCSVSEIFIHFSPLCIKIQGKVNKNNTNVDPSASETRNDDTLKLIILPSEVYSYYCDSDYYLKFKMTEWSVPLCDVDESVNKITLKYKAGENTLSFEAHNSSVKCIFVHQPHLDIVNRSEIVGVDEKILTVSQNADIVFENVTASFKKILCKPCRKKSTDCRLELTQKNITLRFSLDNRKSDMIIPTTSAEDYNIKINEKKQLRDEIQAINKTGKILNYKFPISDVVKFLVHIKEMKSKMMFSSEAMTMTITHTDSNFIYYHVLDN